MLFLNQIPMKYVVFFLLIFSSSVQAQFEMNGKVIDAITKKPLPFASIFSPNSFSVADFDGNYIVNNLSKNDSITVTYVGYKTLKLAAKSEKNFDFKLIPISENLKEVAVGKNPANKIISKVIALKDKNSPDKKLNSFQFKVYNKLVITANPDSINGTLDSIFVTRQGIRKFVKLDSTDLIFKKIISKQHIYQTEKISKVQFDGSYRKETVEATKMAGFKKPIYELIGLKLQSLSIYDNTYDLLENTFNGPLGSEALKDYSFKVLDTLSIQNRDVYLIFFSNKKRKKENGLHGVLYIDKENYAVAKAILRVKNLIDISATHEYLYFPEQKLWFPNARTFKIVKGNNDENIKILGGQIEFQGDNLEDFQKSREKATSDFVYLLSKSVYFEHTFDQPVSISNKTLSIEIPDSAIKKSELFWEQNRKDTLDFRGIETYKSLDSLVISRGIERKLNIGRRILDGYAPLSIIDLDLRYLVKYNNFEGFRFGLGGVTNDRLSSVFKLDGYAAYGLKDEKLKYKYGTSIRVGKASNTWIGGSYTDDVREIASTSFAIDKRVFKIYDPRPINVSTFYKYKQIRGYIETQLMPKTESIWELSQTKVVPAFEYVYTTEGEIFKQYTLTTFMVSLQWNPFSHFMLTPSSRLEIEKKYPKFTFQVTKTLPGLMGNDFEFTKFDLRVDMQKKFINGQRTSLYSEFGYALGDVPLTHLYNASPNNLNRDRLMQRITLAGKNSFETMFFNEFFSSKYAFFQLKHSFKRIKLFKKVKPSLVLVSRMGWGSMERREQHLDIDFKTLEKGYFESGVELNQLYKGLGISGFYRYGPNQLSRFEDNIAVKATFVFDLGF